MSNIEQRLAILEGALEAIAGDEKAYHTCEHSEKAASALAQGSVSPAQLWASGR